MTATPHILGRGKTILRQPVACKAADQATGTHQAVTVVSDTPKAGVGIAVAWIDFGYRTSPTNGSIQISDGTNTWGPFTVSGAGLNTRRFNPWPLLFAPGAAVTVTLADGGVGIVGDLQAKFVYDGTQEPF